MNRTSRYVSSRDVVRDVDDYERAAKRRREEQRSADHDPTRQLIDPQYRTLCISPFSQRIPDEDVKAAIYHAFLKFGDFNVKIVYSGSRRLAYIDFRYPEDAFAAKQSHQDKLVLFDEPVRIDVVYSTKQPRTRSRSPADVGGDSYRRRSRSPYAARTAMKDGNSGYEVPRDAGGPGGYHDRALPKDSKYASHHYSQCTLPEDDETATRTLFVGNLDYDVSADELQNVFGRYGHVEDVDVKRAPGGNGAYAFIRFANLDMAFRAKLEMSGQTIGRHQCRIGYGKMIPSTCLWVGGIGPWLTPDALGRVFGRQAAVKHVEWPAGQNYAYVVFECIEDAQSALTSLRGAPLGGQERRLRIDFADVAHIGVTFDVPRNGRTTGRESDAASGSRRDQPPAAEDSWRRHDSDAWSGRPQPSSSDDRANSSSERRTTDMSDVHNATSITELGRRLRVVWSGRLMLKNSAFAVKLLLIEGESQLVDSLLRDPTTTERTSLKITQRLRLDESKIQEVRRRVSLAGPPGCCMMLAVPADDADVTANPQHRPLKNLVAYLRQKNAAGVILLPPNSAGSGSRTSHLSGLLHAFPPCDFARQQLMRCAPNLNSDAAKEEHLVVLVVRIAA